MGFSKLIIQSILKKNKITDEIIVKNEDFYSKIIQQQSVGLGESYVNGIWECESLDDFFMKLTSGNFIKSRFYKIFLSRIFYRRSKSYLYEHYNLGNELYKLMLDKELSYSCGYWREANNLNDAQYAKLDLICKKLSIKPGDRVLDIGCGFGSFARHASKKYGAEVVGVTLSQQQFDLAQTLSKGMNITYLLQDFFSLSRQQHGDFDHVVSIGMFEHVGHKNYYKFFNKINELLKDDGLIMLHTIGVSSSRYARFDPWTDKYIFPNGSLPSIKEIIKTTDKYFRVEDLHNFGSDYDKTLMAWHKNFCENWNLIKHDYDDKFYRMWNYYLLCCAGSFRSRLNQLWQVVLVKHSRNISYMSVR